MTKNLGRISELKKALDTLNQTAWAIRKIREETGLSAQTDLNTLVEQGKIQLENLKKEN